MINRREFVGITFGAGAALALTPKLLFAQQPGKLIQRAIPSSGEKLPVVSYGVRKAEPAALQELFKAMLDSGVKVADVMHGGPASEQSGRTTAHELGIQDKLLWTSPGVGLPPNAAGPVLPGAIPKADPAAVRARFEQKFAQLNVPKVDLVMVSTLSDAPTHLAVLREMKKEGRVRYIGVHHLAWLKPSPTPFAELEAIMRNEQIDFVGTDYSLADRRAEETILPLATERKIAFMAYFTFDRGRLFKATASTPLPAWAAEFDARSWAQVFVKYVVSHPAVTMARVGTSNPAHLLENIGGGIGRLPNEAARRRLAELANTFLPATAPALDASSGRSVQSQLPPAPGIALAAAVLDRYVGEYKHEAVGTMVTIRRDGDKLLVKVQTGGFSEKHFVAQSETRFVSTPWALEFQLDGQGRVTGAMWEGAQDRIPLVRK